MRAFLMAVMTSALLVLPAAAQDFQDDESDIERTIDGGVASYYGNELAGNRTANGERFNPSELTAAHRTLAFGSKVRVTNTANGQSVIVRVNDRGPFARGRVIDISHAAAKKIGMHRTGTAKVKLALLVD